MQRKALWVGISTVTALVLVTAIWFVIQKPAALHGAVINPPWRASEIELQQANGGNFTLSSLHGKVVVLYFGYTNCPDECPLTMAHLKLALSQMGSQASDVRVAMITTDPKRDTPQALQTFLGKFNPDFIGLLGSEAQLAKVWKDYGVTVEDSGETHSFFIYVVDPAGNIRETLLPDTLPADMASDFQMLAAGR
jgi:protein SCO1